MLEGDRFRSTSTGAVYKIKPTIDCRSKNIIYLVTCKRCRIQGVGSTLDFQGRVSDYTMHMYKEKDTCEIVEHFLNPIRPGLFSRSPGPRGGSEAQTPKIKVNIN